MAKSFFTNEFELQPSQLKIEVTDFKRLLGNLNDIFIKMLTLLMFFVPPVVFFAMVNLALDSTCRKNIAEVVSEKSSRAHAESFCNRKFGRTHAEHDRVVHRQTWRDFQHISVTTIAGHFGVPMEIATLIFCIDALSDRLGTCVNVLSNMTSTLTLARTENLVDEKIYFRN